MSLDLRFPQMLLLVTPSSPCVKPFLKNLALVLGPFAVIDYLCFPNKFLVFFCSLALGDKTGFPMYCLSVLQTPSKVLVLTSYIRPPG